MSIEKADTVYIFPGCVTELFSKGTIKKTVVFLRQLGYDPVVAPEGLCCGQVAWNAGMPHITRNIAGSFINWLRLIPKNAAIVSLSASCVSFAGKYLKRLYNLPMNIPMEFSQFLQKSTKFQKWYGVLRADVALHVSCHHLRDLDRGDALLQILSRINGIKVLPFENPELCCGFGGIFSLIFPELSRNMTERKLTGMPKNVNYLTSADVSCLWKLKQVLKENKIHVKVVHFVDLLYDASVNKSH